MLANAALNALKFSLSFNRGHHYRLRFYLILNTDMLMLYRKQKSSSLRGHDFAKVIAACVLQIFRLYEQGHI